MANTYMGGPITVIGAGSTVTTGAASARIATPVDQSGELARYVRVAATVESYVKFGNATVVATANDVLVQPGDAIVVAVCGSTNIAYIQGTASGKVNVVPLENC